MLDYNALAAMSAVIREGSFERAARALSITPSAISQRIRALEERTGCALVVRGQPCRATEVGQRLCQHVDHVRWLEQELQRCLPGLSPDTSAAVTLPIAVNADSLATWVIPAIAAFSAESGVLLDVTVDDQDHTAQWLRSGAVLAVVTGAARAATGCNSLPLGAMRYLAVASPAFIDRHFVGGVDAHSLARAPCLTFDNKDELQARWALHLCHRRLELPRHSLPSPQAFVAATLEGMGWGLHPEALVTTHLAGGSLLELVPATPLDVPLYWQFSRAAASLVNGLTRHIADAAKATLVST